MKRKNPTTTATEAGELMRSKPPAPPDHVDVPAEAMPAWWAIVTAKATAAWTDADLALAGELARTLCDLENLRRDVREQGDIGPDGKVNPLHGLSGDLTGRAIKLTRLLQIHPLATQGRSADQSKRNTAARDSRDTAADADADLIPTGSGSKH